MCTTLDAKFAGSGETRALLVAWHPHRLLSIKRDRFWGFDAELDGKNILGELLTQVREGYVSEYAMRICDAKKETKNIRGALLTKIMAAEVTVAWMHECALAGNLVVLPLICETVLVLLLLISWQFLLLTYNGKTGLDENEEIKGGGGASKGEGQEGNGEGVAGDV